MAGITKCQVNRTYLGAVEYCFISRCPGCRFHWNNEKEKPSQWFLRKYPKCFNVKNDK